MKKTIFASILLITVWCPIMISAQSIHEKRADLFYENMSYSKASSMYESLYKKNPQNGKFVQRLAYCYNKMSNYKKALLYYSYLVQLNERTLADYYEYAQLLRIDGQLDESKKWLEKYLQLDPENKRVLSQYSQLNELYSIKDKMKMVEIKEVDGNSRFTDMCPTFYNDRLVFSSAKDSFSMIRNEFKWNGQPFLKLYVTNPNPQSDFREASTFSKKLNTRVHEGPVCFTSDYTTIYFTRNSTIGVKSKKSPNRINNLKIFISRFDGNDWSEPENFTYNSDNYSVGHPALSSDNKTLYFISDVPGGFGQTDIYRSIWLDGRWSKPENLGESINTEGKEMFPFVDKEGILYFSSDGRPGMAGLDIYAAKSDENGQYLVANFGAPLNSKYDDFGFIWNTDSMSGYYTSNRPGGAGADDLYSFSVKGIDLQVTSKLASTGEILPFTKINLITENEEILASAISDKDGLADFFVEMGKKYMISAEKMTYHSDIKQFSVSNQLFELEKKEVVLLREDNSYLTIKVIDRESGLIIPWAIVDISEGKYDESALEAANGLINMKMNNSTDYSITTTAKGYFPNTVKFTTIGKDPGTFPLTIPLEKLSTGKQFTLEDLYYDLNKSNIRPDAALVLEKIAQILIENPEVRIEIGSHTDSRATGGYNLKLSQRRSESVVAYLISKGISADRLVAKGFGESQLINRCADGIKCLEEEHQANRRTVIEILNKDFAKVKNGNQNL